VRPVILLREGHIEQAADALRRAPEPPAGQLAEALWCLLGEVAGAVGDRAAAARIRAALEPAAGELAGGASGLLSFGPVSSFLDQVPV
jgi:hypothetical protein